MIVLTLLTQKIKVFKNGVLQTSPAQYSFNTTSNNITFVTAPAINDIIIAELYPSDFYRLGTVIYKNDTLVQMVERNEFYLIQRSPLTAATKVQPIFFKAKSIINLVIL